MKSSFTAVRRLGIFACAMVAGLAALPTGEARAAQALNYPTLTPPRRVRGSCGAGSRLHPCEV
ncbi:MAG: hypothetical protein A4E73_03367 [Syntrophaceae bacterium PtaU1.Bin231]|nr:MAG: hypothetical protein A4E73_03367 [Syntrophaceae bacterium PtaU1.Bin231]